MMDVQVSSEQWSNDVTLQGSDPDFLAVMARVMCLASEETTRRGSGGLRLRQDRLVSPRGRIDIAEIVRRPGLETPVPCRFDEHTVDVPLNPSFELRWSEREEFRPRTRLAASPDGATRRVGGCFRAARGHRLGAALGPWPDGKALRVRRTPRAPHPSGCLTQLQSAKRPRLRFWWT